MAIVSRLELNHPDLGTTGGAALHASVEALYEKIGDALSSRWFSIADFDQGNTVDLNHNFSTDINNLRYDLWNFVGGEWVKVDAGSTPSSTDFTVIEKVGDESDVLTITNNTGGNDLVFAVSVVFDPIYLADGDVKDLNIVGIQDKQHLQWNQTAGELQPSSELSNKILENVTFAEESLAAATTIAPTKMIVRVTSAAQIDMIDPATTKALILVNDSGSTFAIGHLTGATAANQINTGTGGDITLDDQASIWLAYDDTDDKWRIVGGTGSGAGGLEIEVISASQTAEVGKHYKTDSSGGTFTLTLPDPTGFTPTELLNARVMVQDDKLACGTAGQEVVVAPHSGGQLRDTNTTYPADEALNINVQGFWVEFTWNPVESVWMQRDVFIASKAGSVEVQIPITRPDELQTLVISDFNNTTGLTLGSATTQTHRLNKKRLGASLFIDGGFHFNPGSTEANPLQLNLEYDGNPVVPKAGRYPALTTTQTINAANNEYFRDVFVAVADGVNPWFEFERLTNNAASLAGANIGSGSGENNYFSFTATVPIEGWEETETVTLEVPTPASATISIPKVTPWEAYTPTNTQGFGTITSRLQTRQNGESREIIGDFDVGSIQSLEAQIELPNSETINYKTASANNNIVGEMLPDFVNNFARETVLARHGDTYLRFGRFLDGSSSNMTAAVLGTELNSTSGRAAFYASVPVLEFSGALAYETITVPIEGGSAGSGGSGGTNFLLNGDATEDTANTSNVTRQTTAPLDGVAHFDVASGQTGSWSSQVFSNYIVDNGIAVGVRGIVEVAAGGSGRVFIHDGTAEVAGTSYDLVEGFQQLGFNFIPTQLVSYQLRIESTSGLIKADKLAFTDDSNSIPVANIVREYRDDVVTITSAGLTQQETSFRITYDPFNDKYFADFNFAMSGSGITSATISIAGISFPSGNQACYGGEAGSGDGLDVHTVGGTGNISFIGANSVAQIYIGGKVELAGKPTWADFDGSLRILDSGNSVKTGRAVFKMTNNTTASNVALDLSTPSGSLANSGFSVLNGVYEAKFSGTVRLFLKLTSTTTFSATANLRLYINAVLQETVGTLRSGDTEGYGEYIFDIIKGQTFEIRPTAAFGTIFATSFITLAQISEQSLPAVAGVLTSSQSNEIARPVLVPVQKVDLNLRNVGDFANTADWPVKVRRIDDVVTISLTVSAAHSSDSAPTSLAGFIPEWARPTVARRNTYWYDTSNAFMIIVEPDGELYFEYTSETAAIARGSTSVPASITYVID